MINLVSCSGGKDSTATLLCAIESGSGNVQGVFCDTGNEHQATYDYVNYLERTTGIQIKWLRQDFSDWITRRAIYVRDKWPEKGVPDNIVRRALELLEQGSTGNPFLDLCIIKGRFPSRMAQFCTQYLKSEPATEYALELIEQHGAVESWQGVRAEESLIRAKLPEWEDRGGGYTINRPIHKWTVDMVFAKHKKHGIEPNPLYKQGMGRVGCMPCINAKKDEVLEISKRFPQEIERIAEWERIVSQASKRSSATFFASRGDNEGAFERGNISQVVRWSKTSHGGIQIDAFRELDDSPACSSAYGLCE